MAVINACVFPEELLYAVEENVWLRVEGDGEVTMGMVDPAQTAAGKILAVSFRGSGRHLTRGKGGATVESGKWVGPFVLPVSGRIVRGNGRLLEDPGLLNRDPYGDGWILRLAPSRWEEEKALLLPGPQAVTHYREKLEREGISCLRCAGG